MADGEGIKRTGTITEFPFELSTRDGDGDILILSSPTLAFPAIGPPKFSIYPKGDDAHAVAGYSNLDASGWDEAPTHRAIAVWAGLLDPNAFTPGVRYVAKMWIWWETLLSGAISHEPVTYEFTAAAA